MYVRVNAVPSEWFAADVADGVAPEVAGVIVPEARVAGPARRPWPRRSSAPASGTCTSSPVSRARMGSSGHESSCTPPVAVAYFGAEDFIADMGGVRTAAEHRGRCTRGPASRWRPGSPASSPSTRSSPGSTPRTTSSPTPPSDARIGYRGKLCIHPAQVALANRAFSPSPEELDRARRLLAAYDDAVARGEAAIAFEGQMVDEPLARHARAVLAAAAPA